MNSLRAEREKRKKGGEMTGRRSEEEGGGANSWERLNFIKITCDCSWEELNSLKLLMTVAERG